MSLPSATVFLLLKAHTVRNASKILSQVSGTAARRLQTWSAMEECCKNLTQEQREDLVLALETTVPTRTRNPKPYSRPEPHTALASTLPTAPSQRPEADQTLGTPDPNGASSSDLDISPQYLECVDQATIDGCVIDFIEQTNNAAMAQAPCVSCARLTFVTELEEMKLEDVPNVDNLRPAKPHPAHQLSHDGVLLFGGPYVPESAVRLCKECLYRLRDNRRPKLSLANGLWVGDLPNALHGLTLPERILISLFLPVAFVVKLYPCGRRTYNTAQDRLHSALKGNVSTYKLDQQQVSDMLGLTMPPPVRILSSTIAITFVGPNNIPKKHLEGPFRVRRHHVSRALYWLKDNNPLYRNIDISEDRLAELPLSGVPPEIGDTARWLEDDGVLDREHGGYVPSLYEESEEEEQLMMQAEADPMLVDDTNEEQADAMEDVQPDRAAGVERVDSFSDVTPPREGPEHEPVIPLLAHGIIDIAGHDIPNDELFTHALANTAGISSVQAEVPKFKVWHSSAFVNEYARKDPVTGLKYDGGPDNPNHLLGCFPYLFPYGAGGFETDQNEPVSYEAHAQWALQYSDRRFRRDLQFVFQVFGVMQKREVCRSATLQIAAVPEIIQNKLRTLTVKDFVKAVEEESRKVPFSNPAIRALRSQMTAIRARVTGTDESRHSIRGKVWSTNTIFNGPSLWITINPPDTQSPVAQVLVGEEIDLDAFCATSGPDSAMRSVNVSSDPFGAAQYFHHTIKCVLEALMGIRRSTGGSHKISRKPGIFGTVQAYIGTVEAQGRGTLHLHLLVWLKDTPRPTQFREALTKEAFRQKVVSFIQQNIQASVDDMTTRDFFLLKKDPEISYCRPLDPRVADSVGETPARIKRAVRSLQFHICKDGVCRVFKRGAVICKRGAPWTLAKDAWVSEAGHWGPRRISGYVNNFNPTFLKTLTCNHDIKILLQGSATRTISWYITNYASKKQQHTANSSALLARRFAFFEKEERVNPSYVESNKRLLQRCANSLSRDREFSAPEVMSYVMKWGDRYESHYYANIYWDKAYRFLLKSYPGLKTQSDRHLDKATGAPSPAQEETETFSLHFAGESLELRDQLKEYACRGDALVNECYLKVFLDTYDALYTEPKDVTEQEPNADVAPRRSRPRHERIPYLPSFGNAKRCRIRRAANHETLPRYIGRWFPRANDPATHELYCASMLLLLKPWRTLADLKAEEDTFYQAFQAMMRSAAPWMKTVVENIQNYYDCADQAKADETESQNSMTYTTPVDEDLRQQFDIVLPHEINPVAGLTEEDVDLARQHKHTGREREFLNSAMMVAQLAGINMPETHDTSLEPIARCSVPDMLPTIKEWETQLKAMTRQLDGRLTAPVDVRDTAAVLAATTVKAGPPSTDGRVTELVDKVADNTDGSLKAILNEEQRRAHDIIVGCVENDMKGKFYGKPCQGGTGKTLLIQAITQTLKNMRAEQLLGKTATSGIAASPIGGSTVHSYFGIPINIRGRDWVTTSSDAIKKRRTKNISGKRIIFIDEMSMMTKSLLCNVSQVCQTVMGQDAATASNSTLPFGGLHIVLLGDLHQFPPVANCGEALYQEADPNGKELPWAGRYTSNLLQSRVGECTEEDVDEVNKLSVLDPRCTLPNFNDPEWSQALLITPRHSLREEWNSAALRKFCHDNGLRRYVIQAQDVDSMTGVKPRLDYRISIAGMSTKNTGRLPSRIEIAKGMKIMVLINVATEADVANGTRGVIEDFWLDPEEGEVNEQDDGTLLLSRLPTVIFFRPDEPAAARFPGVPDGVIPLTPSTTTFEVRQDKSLKNTPKIRVKRTQYAITGAYAFTDYKSQGQTIEKVIIDLTVPNAKDSAISPFNAYVALSRGRGRDSIRLLRPIDRRLLTTHPSEELRVDIERLQHLDGRTTLAWEQARLTGAPRNCDPSPA
ncbi:hypothetical protein NMY22_g12176 [Coprinellus aureogranulatus]|nr:hypothetical protein NMY22_g12176 [Coprinellus aureogranulatus]